MLAFSQHAARGASNLGRPLRSAPGYGEWWPTANATWGLTLRDSVVTLMQ
jgi:hypothetical protein